MKNKDDFTEAEKNLLFLLRTRRNPYEVISIFNGKNGEHDYFRVNIEQKLIITDDGIEEIEVKKINL